MKILDGRELAEYIKERQAKQVRGLRQAWGVYPKLAIVVAQSSPVIDVYVGLKRQYGEDILVEVEVYREPQADIAGRIATLNEDDSVHGIVVQLPLEDTSQTDAILATITPQKDVDGLGKSALFVSATATAIDWLLAGYNVTLKDRRIAVVGQGRLVGAPLTRLWQSAGLYIHAYDETTPNLSEELRAADILVTATGVPGLVTSAMIAPGKVVVDAGTAVEHGKLVGDVARDVRDRDDLTITPIRGGVGPLTVAALFDNVITAARATISEED